MPTMPTKPTRSTRPGPRSTTPEDDARTPEQKLREAVNLAGVAIVQQGFDAIDAIAESATRGLKGQIIDLLTTRKKR